MNLGETYVYIAAFIELLLCAATILNPNEKTVFFFKGENLCPHGVYILMVERKT